MAEKKRGSGGGKLARTETVQVRLDPKLRMAAELAAAKERRTLSSFIEWAVERAVREVYVTGYQNGLQASAADVADNVWDVDEADRFVKLATGYPGLMTHDEQRLWKFIVEYRGYDREIKSVVSFIKNEVPDRQLIRQCWAQINDHLAGTITKAQLDSFVLETYLPF